MSLCPDVLILLMPQVPVLITDHHMRTPGQPFFFSIILHSSTGHADLKTQENSAPGRLEGDTSRHVDGCKGWSVRAISICHEVTRECNTCETGEAACQSNSVKAPGSGGRF